MRLQFRTDRREQLLDITEDVRHVVRESDVRDGMLHLWSLHTTCALTVNEGFDPDVERDIVTFLRRLIPQDAGFRHGEGNSDSHIKVSLVGPGLSLIIENGEILLGTWQRIFLAEFDGPRNRTLALRVG